ncbi:MAG: ACT domain-containing protein [Bacteroidetes bacterium]|nr:ACT domain-containing protein [Bacteroidota bacterium]
MVLVEYPEPFAVLRFPPASKIPAWAEQGPFTSITRTPQELAVICQESLVPLEQAAERGWYLMGCQGPLDFSAVGILAGLAGTLADAGISILTVATYDTDYFLTRDPDRARTALQEAGHEVIRASSSETSI